MGSMSPLLTFLLMIMSGWVHRHQLTHYLLFVIRLADRVVQVLGVTAKPDEAWILQIGRNLVDSESGALCGKRYLTIDRDTKYTDQFCRLVREAGTEVIQLPPCRRI
jgi:putative transposase